MRMVTENSEYFGPAMIFFLVLAVISATGAFAAYQYDPYTGQYVQKSEPGFLSRLSSLPGKVFGGIWGLLSFFFQTVPLSIAYIYSSILTFLGFVEGKPTYMNFYQGYGGYPTMWG